VTRHANMRRRNAGDGGTLHADVTIAAIDAQTAGMMFVTEGHRLSA
jgi:hypothetical protein